MVAYPSFQLKRRSLQRATYVTVNNPSVVYYTALASDGVTVLTPRTPVTLPPIISRTGYKMYGYDQPMIINLTDWIAVWDEGDPNVYTASWEVVSTFVGALEVASPPQPPAATAPGVPLSATAVAGNTQATITFSPPADDGGSLVLSYTVTATDATTSANGGQIVVGASSPITVSGLTNGDTYTFRVAATNSIGTGGPSAATNSVVPVAPPTIPGQPIAPTAIGGNAQATITYTAPQFNGGSAITSYTVTAHDTTVPPGNQTITANSLSQTITGLTNAHTYYFTVTAHNAVGDGPQSVASNTVVPATGGGGAGIATFTYSQPTSSTVLLDATGSNGTLTWNVDTVDATAHTTTLQIGPLVIGSHHIKLTAVASTTAISEQDIDVAWVGRPLWAAQNDAVDGNPGSGLTLPQWSDLKNLGPFRNKGPLNEAEVVPPGDGIPRIVVISDNEITLLTKYGDRPGTTGGYRSSMELTNAYKTDVTGLAGPSLLPFRTNQNIDPCGMLTGNGTGAVRFYRVDFRFDAAVTPSPTYFSGIGVTPWPGWQYQNNAFEIHGNIGGSSPIRFQTDGPGKNWQWSFESIQNGVTIGGQKNFDTRPMLFDTWYLYIVEAVFDLDPTKGYVRIWRDLGSGYQPVITNVPTGTILTGSNAGKYFAVTQQTDSTGAVVLMAFDIQNYRTKSTMPPTYPDATIRYRNVLIGPTMASVLI